MNIESKHTEYKITLDLEGMIRRLVASENRIFELEQEQAANLFEMPDQTRAKVLANKCAALREGRSIVFGSNNAGDMIVGLDHSSHRDLTDEYYALVCNAVEHPASRDMMFHFSRDALAKREAHIITVIDCGNRIIGGLHWHLASKNDVMVRAVVVSPDARGRSIGKALVAAAVQQSEFRHGADINHICAIRVMPDNSDNVRSVKTFAAIGFLAEAEAHHKALTGDDADTHLFTNAETNDDGTKFIRYRRMLATKSTSVLARNFLAGWSQTHAA